MNNLYQVIVTKDCLSFLINDIGKNVKDIFWKRLCSFLFLDGNITIETVKRQTVRTNIIVNGFHDLIDVLQQNQLDLYLIRFIIKSIDVHVTSKSEDTVIMTLDLILYIIGERLAEVMRRIVSDIMVVVGHVEYNFHCLSEYFDCDADSIFLAVTMAKYMIRFNIMNDIVQVRLEEITDYQCEDSLIRYHFQHEKIKSIKLFIHTLLTFKDKRNGIHHKQGFLYLSMYNTEIYHNFIRSPHFLLICSCI